MPVDSLVAVTVIEEWCAVLDEVGVGRMVERDVDFFDAGGNSLSAIGLIERVERRLGIEFPVEALFFDGRLTELIAQCEERYGSAGAPA